MSASNPPARMSREILLSIYVPAAIVTFSRALILPLVPLFALSFEASYSMVGIVIGAQGIGNLVADVPAGMIIRRLGRKRVMLCGAAVIALSAAAVAWAGSLSELVLYRFISGVGMALWNISRHSYLTEHIPRSRRGLASATMGGIGRISGFVGPVLGGLLATAFGYRLPFVVCAAFGLMGLVATARLVAADDAGRAERKRGEEENAEAGPPAGLAEVLRSHYRILLSAGSGQLCAQMIRAARNVIIPLYATDALGLDAAAVGLITSVSYGVDMLLFVPAGMIMDRFGRKFASVPSFVIQSAAMACIPLTSGFGELMAVATAIGLGNGIGAGTMLTLGSDLAPSRARAEFLGMWRLIGDSGHAGGALVVGRVADLAGLGMAPFVVAAMGLAGAAILGLLVPETLRKQARPPPSA